MSAKVSKEVRRVRTASACVLTVDHVHLATMDGRVGGELERRRAEAAFEGLVAGVDRDVIAQTLGGQEGFRADRAAECAHLQVRANVLVHAELAAELAAANVAGVVEYAAMDWHVLAEIGRFGEGGRTLLALDGSGIGA